MNNLALSLQIISFSVIQFHFEQYNWIYLHIYPWPWIPDLNHSLHQNKMQILWSFLLFFQSPSFYVIGSWLFQQREQFLCIYFVWSHCCFKYLTIHKYKNVARTWDVGRGWADNWQSTFSPLNLSYPWTFQMLL